MDGFWMRVGRAAALRREAHAVFEHLSRENRFLTTVLRDIATGRDREIVEAIDERRRKIPRKFR